MKEDELIFVGAAILLAQMVGMRAEPAHERQIQIALDNAYNLSEAVKKRSKDDPDRQRLGLVEWEKQQAKKS